MFSIPTNRLKLRDVILSDWELFYTLMKDSDTNYYMGDYIQADTEAKAKSWVDERIKYNNEIPRHSYNLAIEYEGKTVGWIGIGEADEEEKKDLDFGYALKREYWGKGIMTEALRLVLDLCFQTMPINRITGECETQNVASRIVMKNAGMIFDKHIRIKDVKTGKIREKVRLYIHR
jgi:[ribosomal protein S5]-alanine N-acetyltransferase